MADFVLPIISGFAGLFGGGKQQQTQQSQQGSQNQNYSNSGYTTPQLSPFQTQLANLFTQGTINQYNQGTNLAPYTSQGLQSIGNQGALQNQVIKNSLAARGLSYSPAASTATTMSSLNTGNQANQFLQGVPLLQRQLQQGNLQQLMQAFGVQPTGVQSGGSGSSAGTSSSSGTSSTYGNPTAGLFGGLGAGLASMPNLMSSLNSFNPFGGSQTPTYVGVQPGQYGTYTGGSW